MPLGRKAVINDEIGGQAENVIYGFAKKGGLLR